MLKIVIHLILIELCIFYKENSIESTNSVPNFRKQVEGITFDNKVLTEAKDANNNLVLFLIKNIKEILAKETTVVINLDNNNNKNIATASPLQNKDEYKVDNITIDENKFSLTEAMDADKLYFNLTNKKKLSERSTKSFKENITYFTFIKNVTIMNLLNAAPTEFILDSTKKAKLENLSNDLAILQKSEQDERENHALESIINPLNFDKPEKEIRSCMLCNNVAEMECNDPENKLIPFTVCPREEDLCYSLHTPFGIVDRGCLNVNYNLTTYVCCCSHCNNIAIFQMPYIFPTKRDWIDNVLELSRARRLRHSILKGISCLRCEVNTSTNTGDMLDRANCLEGINGTLPIQECSENEICGVKAIRSEGYIWRGCIAKPLYNYWWTLCVSNLCNYDKLVSIYDKL